MVWSFTEKGELSNEDPFSSWDGTSAGGRTPSPLVAALSDQNSPLSLAFADQSTNASLPSRERVKLKAASQLNGWDDVGLVVLHRHSAPPVPYEEHANGWENGWQVAQESEGAHSAADVELGTDDDVLWLDEDQTASDEFWRSDSEMPTMRTDQEVRRLDLEALNPDLDASFGMTGQRVSFLHIIHLVSVALGVSPQSVVLQPEFDRVAQTAGVELDDAVQLVQYELQQGSMSHLHYTGHEVYW
jgi:hypothetical protein